MINEVIRIVHPGRRNPRVEISAEDAATIKSRIVSLPEPAFLSAPPIKCWPEGLKGPPLYLFAFADDTLVYVSGRNVDELVDGPGRRRIDENEDLSKAAEEFFRTLPLLDRECEGCTPQNLGQRVSCGCDGSEIGVDLSDWHYKGVVRSSNCYAYARRIRCCAGNGLQPGGSESTTRKQLLAGIKRDGLRRIDKADLTDKDVALFMEVKANYHFLRLDGGFWTHKFSFMPAAACDYLGHSMPKDDLEKAVMPPGFDLTGYFRLPPDSHRSLGR